MGKKVPKEEEYIAFGVGARVAWRGIELVVEKVREDGSLECRSLDNRIFLHTDDKDKLTPVR